MQLSINVRKSSLSTNENVDGGLEPASPLLPHGRRAVERDRSGVALSSEEGLD